MKKHLITIILLAFSFAFGSNAMAEDIATTHAETPTIFNKNNLIGFNDSNRHGTSGNSLKVNTAMQITKNSDGTFRTDKITGSVVDFAYNADGKFNDLILYFGDKKYQETRNGDDYRLQSNRVSVASDDADFSLDNSFGRFGFKSNYMARLLWFTNDDDFGFGMVGFETDGHAIPAISNVWFTGNGLGFYRSNTETTNRRFFNFRAHVDFSNRTVNLESINTCSFYNLVEQLNCRDNHKQDYLNFSGNLSYVAGTNSISGIITTAGDADNASMTGIADARFYGSAFEELGGTFSLASDTAGYVGYFGAQRGKIIPIDTVATTHAETPTTFNKNNLTSFDDTTRNGTTNNAFKVTPIVQITRQRNGNNEITSKKFLGSVVDIDYKDDGQLDALRLYIDDKKYSTINAIYYGQFQIIAQHSTIAVDGGGDKPSHLELLRGDHDLLTYERPDYMILVELSFYESDYYSYNFGIAGFETVGSAIPKTGTSVGFTGRGKGVYYVDGQTGVFAHENIQFSVTADVNFEARNVTLSTDSCSAANGISCQIARDEFNLTGTLSYAADINGVSGTVQIAGNADNAVMNGTADARFYGPAAEEFGGTFSLTNDNSSYIGYFGAKR